MSRIALVISVYMGFACSSGNLQPETAQPNESTTAAPATTTHEPTPSPAAIMPQPITDAVGRLATEITEVAPAWTVRRSDQLITLSTTVEFSPMNSAAGELESAYPSITVTTVPFVNEATQAARLAAAQVEERRLWRTVQGLQCQGMRFDDHYIEGLCFRTRSERQDRRVAAYRQAREVWRDVPRHHVARELSLSIRLRGAPELSGGPCEVCDTTLEGVTRLFEPYPVP